MRSQIVGSSPKFNDDRDILPGDVDAMRRTLERALCDASARAAAEYCGVRMGNFDVERVLDVFEELLTDAHYRSRHLDA